MSERRYYAMIGEPLADAETPNEMRKAINEYRHHGGSGTVKQTMYFADAEGLSAEDRYTILSYHLLKDCEQLRKILYEEVSARPAPIFIVEKDAQKKSTAELELEAIVRRQREDNRNMQ